MADSNTFERGMRMITGFNPENGELKKYIEKLALCLNNLEPVNKRQDTHFDTAPERLLDCVLSLHRRYDEFAVPRITEFETRHPEVNTLTDLSRLVASSGGPVEFYQNELNYYYADSAEMFGKVMVYLMTESNEYPGNNDMERCYGWATSARIDGYKSIWDESNIPLFGIAGWQYLRMLFGADTCKPDIAVKKYVKDCLKRDFTGCQIVELMENAAILAPNLKTFSKPVREADRRIWHEYNNRKKQNKGTVCH
jgi:hypothetical protein